MKFPKEIEIVLNTETNGSKYLMVNMDDAEDGDKVAVYTLKEIRTMKVSKKLV